MFFSLLGSSIYQQSAKKSEAMKMAKEVNNFEVALKIQTI